jgi:hypothetical protein
MRSAVYTIGLISSICFVVGWAFQILHLPGATELYVYGFLGFAFLFLPLLAIREYKKYAQLTGMRKLKIILGFASAFITGLSVVFKMFHLQGAPLLLMIGVSLFALAFLPVLFFTLYKSNS